MPSARGVIGSCSDKAFMGLELPNRAAVIAPLLSSGTVQRGQPLSAGPHSASLRCAAAAATALPDPSDYCSGHCIDIIAHWQPRVSSNPEDAHHHRRATIASIPELLCAVLVAGHLSSSLTSSLLLPIDRPIPPIRQSSTASFPVPQQTSARCNHHNGTRKTFASVD